MVLATLPAPGRLILCYKWRELVVTSDAPLRATFDDVDRSRIIEDGRHWRSPLSIHGIDTLSSHLTAGEPHSDRVRLLCCLT